MDNECHANICVFVQNSPDPPIYTFWSYDSHRDRVIKSLKFETNVNVHSCLSPVAPPPLMSACVRFFLNPSSQSCGRLLWMTPNLNRLHKILFKLR